MKYRIIAAKAADWKALHELEKQCFPPPDIFRPTVLKHLLASPTCEVFLITCEKHLLGSVAGLFRHFPVPSGRVYKIAVAPEFQGQGFAGIMLDFIEKRFRKQGMVKSCAEVRINNISSRLMFQKHGYQEKGILKAYYPDREDGIKFWKTL